MKGSIVMKIKVKTWESYRPLTKAIKIGGYKKDATEDCLKI